MRKPLTGEPVSYTHLDVYKRQLLLLPLLAFLLHRLSDQGQRIQGRTESAAMNLAQISAHTLERQLSDTQQFLATMAARPNVRALDVSRCCLLYTSRCV